MNLGLGCSQSRIYHGRVRGRGKSNNNKRKGNGQKIQASKVVCPYCFITVAPYAKQIKTSKGTAHYDCAITKVMEKLKVAGLPVPSIFTFGGDFKNYLTKQAEELLSQSPDDWEDKLAEIINISEEIFMRPIDLSTLMAKQSQGLSP